MEEFLNITENPYRFLLMFGCFVEIPLKLKFNVGPSWSGGVSASYKLRKYQSKFSFVPYFLSR